MEENKYEKLFEFLDNSKYSQLSSKFSLKEKFTINPDYFPQTEFTFSESNLPNVYTCPNAKGVNKTGDFAKYCIFDNRLDAKSYCDSDINCIGILTDEVKFQAVNKLGPGKDNFWSKRQIIYPPKYTTQNEKLWPSERAGVYRCPDAVGVNKSGDFSNYCIFNNRINAENYCNSDDRCIGFSTNGSIWQVTKKFGIGSFNTTSYTKKPDQLKPENHGFNVESEQFIWPKKKVSSIFEKNFSNKSTYPFKVWRLQDLLNQGKARLVWIWNNQQLINGTRVQLAFFKMKIPRTDQFIPVGDVFAYVASDYWNVPVLGIVNDTKYMRFATSFIQLTNTSGCNTDGRFTWYRGESSGDFLSIGGAMYNDENVGDTNAPLRPFDGVNPSYGLVHKDYLTKLQPNYEQQLISTERDGCNGRHFMILTSFFNTFLNVNSITKQIREGDKYVTVTDMTNFDPYYDIITEEMIAYCCSNGANSKLSFCNSMKGDYSDNYRCTKFMTGTPGDEKDPGYCSGDNLFSKDNYCYNFCKTNSVSNNNSCELNLTKFCRSDPSNYFKYPYLCSCFMNSDFYQKIQERDLSTAGTVGQALIKQFREKKIYEQPPECIDTQCKASSTIGLSSTPIQHVSKSICPSDNVLICINEARTTNMGEINANTLNQNQIIQCSQEQNIGGSTSNIVDEDIEEKEETKTSRTSSTSSSTIEDKSEMNWTLIIGVIIALILILIIFYFVFKQQTETPQINIQQPQPK